MYLAFLGCRLIFEILNRFFFLVYSLAWTCWHTFLIFIYQRNLWYFVNLHMLLLSLLFIFLKLFFRCTFTRFFQCWV
jgi:hypothetical protein